MYSVLIGGAFLSDSHTINPLRLTYYSSRSKIIDLKGLLLLLAVILLPVQPPRIIYGRCIRI